MTDLLAQRLRLLWVAGVLAPAAMIFAGYLVAWLGPGPIPDLLRLPSGRAVLMGLVTSGVSMGLLFLLHKSSKRFEQALRESGTRVGEEALRVAGYPVMVVVVTMAALGEEVLFRGALQPILGLPLAAFLFGFSHGGWRRENWAYVVAATLSGLLFGSVYLWTADLWVPIIAHGGHNLLSTLFLGKRVDIEWRGPWPVIRLVPEEEEKGASDEREIAGIGASGTEQNKDEGCAGESAGEPMGEPVWEAEEPAGELVPETWFTLAQEATLYERMDDPLPSETDRPDDGPDLGTDPDRPPE